MNKIVCFCGLPGAGKSHARTHDPELKNAKHIDVADVYHDFPGIDYATAFGEVINQVVQAMDDRSNIAVEACFFRESFQRDWIKMIARANGYTVEFREFFAPPDVLAQRIEVQFKEDLERANGNVLEEQLAKERRKARLEISQNATFEEAYEPR